MSPDEELCLAVETGNLEDVRKALAAGAHADARAVPESTLWLSQPGHGINPEGWTALTYASWLGHTRIVKLLIATGADVEARSTWGITPLMMAAARGNTGAARMLLDAGATIDSANDQGTPMTWAAAEGRIETLRFLLEKGANPNGNNHPEMSGALWSAVSQNRPRIIQLLKMHGADVNARDREGKTALDLACFSRRTKRVAAALLAAGAEDSITAATYRHDLKALRSLLRRGVDPNGREYPKMSSALSWAIYKDLGDVIGILAKHGADFNVRHPAGDTALGTASAWGKKRAAAALLAGGATDTLHSAAARGDSMAVETLLDAKALRTKNAMGQTPLHCAAARGQTHIIDRLLAVPGISLKNSRFAGILAAAAGSGSTRAVTFLVEKGCDINELNDRPIVRAVDTGSAVVARKLLKLGANPNALDEKGWPILFNAVHGNYPKVVRVLLAHGADVHQIGPDDTDLQSIVDCVAQGAPVDDLVDLLQQHGFVC